MYNLTQINKTLVSTRKVINLGVLDTSTGDIINTNETIKSFDDIFIYENTDTLKKVYLVTEMDQDIINFYDSNNLFIGTFEKVEKLGIENIINYVSADLYVDY